MHILALEILMLEKQLAGQGQEISDLRQLLFGSKGSTAPLGIHFPYRTGSHIIVFGGAEPWLNQMKEKLPDITFLEGVRKDLLSQLRKADMIWLQTDGMSRDVYQSIIREVSKHNLSLRYFSNAVVADCADQLINADIASC